MACYPQRLYTMGWIRAALFIVATFSTATVVSDPDSRTVLKSSTSDAGSTDGDGAFTLTSLIPCQGCGPRAEDDTLRIELLVPTNDVECRSHYASYPNEKQVRLNDIALEDSVWHRSITTQIWLSAALSNTPTKNVEVEAIVQLNCLNHDTSLMSFAVVNIDRHPALPLSGFTVSFKQKGGARALLYKNFPLAVLDGPEVEQEWGDEEVVLAQKYYRLKPLETINQDSQNKYHDLYQRIKSTVTNTLKLCDSCQCYLSAARQRSSYLASLIETHFCSEGTGQATTSPSDQILISSKPPWQSVFKQEDTTGDTTAVEEENDSKLNPSPSSRLSYQSHPLATPSPKPLQPHPHHGAGIYGFTSQPSFSVGSKNTLLDRRKAPVLIAAAATIILTFAILIYTKVLRFKTCIDPRWKRDCAALREERRTRAAYRRAACRQRMRRWWTNFRKPQPTSTSDYEEKRARILSQEAVLENVMQREITQTMVHDMVRAEEGQSRICQEMDYRHLSTLPPAYSYYHSHLHPQSSSSSSSHPYSRGYAYDFGTTNTLVNPYNSNSHGDSTTSSTLQYSPPPSYASDVMGDGEMTIIEGFGYAPSTSDGTSESSVVDCNSRMSFDTESLGSRE